MKLTIACRSDAERLLYTDPSITHTISIFDVGSEPLSYYADKPVLQLEFDDASYYEIAQRMGYAPATRDQVKSAIEFGRAIPDDGHLLVHCEAGISRSTAIAFAVLVARGEDPMQTIGSLQPYCVSTKLPDPNELVLGLALGLLAREAWKTALTTGSSS